jgi:hypothetical protein
MIVGNQNWQAALSQLNKQPLFTFEILDFGIVIASFSASEAGISVGGYGVTQYGTNGYGT